MNFSGFHNKIVILFLCFDVTNVERFIFVMAYKSVRQSRQNIYTYEWDETDMNQFEQKIESLARSKNNIQVFVDF